MENRLIFLYPIIWKRSDREGEPDRLTDSGASGAAGARNNAQDAGRDAERTGDQVAKKVMPALKKSFYR